MGQSVCIIVILVNSKAGEPTSFKNAPNKKAGIGFFIIQFDIPGMCVVIAAGKV